MSGVINISFAAAAPPTGGPVTEYNFLDCSLTSNPCGSGGSYSLSTNGAAPLPDPSLSCTPDKTMVFTISSDIAGSHPLSIKTTPGSGTANLFTGNGVSGNNPENNGGTNNNITLNCNQLIADQVTRLYYQCTAHTGMFGQINIGAVQSLPPSNNEQNRLWPLDTVNELKMHLIFQQTILLYDLSGDPVNFHWNLLKPEDEFLTFGISAPASGWLGVAFGNPNFFNMLGSDAFIGHVTDDILNQTETKIFIETYTLASKSLFQWFTRDRLSYLWCQCIFS